MIQNNSNEMKTEVETFIIEETAELIYDNEKLEHWNKMVADLGLAGQAQIIQKEKSPVPFLHMKRELVFTFETLCPAKIEVEKYNLTPIPVEILDLIVLSKREGYFDKIQIWWDDKKIDPCCVGLRFGSDDDRASNYDWRMQKYLIGKWSDVKASFNELKQRAEARFKANKTAELKQRIKDCQRELEDLDNTVVRSFGTDSNLSF